MEMLQKAYGPRERLWTIAVSCGALQCIMAHCGNIAEDLQTTGILPNHCGSLRCIAVQLVHAVAECITHSQKCQNSIYLPCHLANPQKPIANP